jgi:tRNA-dihydrouridine synthase B
MFRKVAPWYAKRFGPAHPFNKRVVLLNRRAEFQEILADYLKWREQFLDEHGELKPQYRPAPLVPSFLQDAEPASALRAAIPVPKGPVEVW